MTTSSISPECRRVCAILLEADLPPLPPVKRFVPPPVSTGAHARGPRPNYDMPAVRGRPIHSIASARLRKWAFRESVML